MRSKGICSIFTKWSVGLVVIRPVDVRRKPIKKGYARFARAVSLLCATNNDLQSKRIDYFEKWELIEIGVAGADAPDPVLAHETSRVCVMEHIAGEVR